MPAADVLPRDTELVGDLGLRAAGGEQLAGLESNTFKGLAVTQTAGVAAVGGWSHAAMLSGQPRSCHRKERTSDKSAGSSLAEACSAKGSRDTLFIDAVEDLRQADDS